MTFRFNNEKLGKKRTDELQLKKGGTWWEGAERENWNSCNSIINKTHFKKRVIIVYGMQTYSLKLICFISQYMSSDS